MLKPPKSRRKMTWDREGKEVDKLAALDLIVLTLGALDADKGHVFPTTPHLSLQRSDQIGVADMQTCVLCAPTCQTMTRLGMVPGNAGGFYSCDNTLSPLHLQAAAFVYLFARVNRKICRSESSFSPFFYTT